MKETLKFYETKAPEIVFEWHDAETEAKGWVVINSLRGGAAGGGTRMRKGLNKHEVVSLAKTMEVKFTVAGPEIGGAKSGIDFDPNDPRKEGVLKRWYKAVKPLLKNYYGTGGDLNVDEIHEVIPMCADLGIEHPQEGVFNGHFAPTPEAKKQIIKQLQEGVLYPVTDKEITPDTSGKYTVADMITGYGVSEAVRHFYDIYGGTLKGKRVIIQGWGNVGAAAAYYQAKAGAKVVGIIDRVGGLLNPDGYSLKEIEDLFLAKNGNYLTADNMLSFEEVNEKIWTVGAEVFIPAAASRLVKKTHVDLMKENGLEVISCGANVPFADQEIFFGPISEYTDTLVSVIPDFIANCGMARVFAFLMQHGVELKDTTIFKDTSDRIKHALVVSNEKDSSKLNLSKVAFEIALKKLV